MTDLTGALCRGRSWLFDSMELADHIEARKLCADCPVLTACDAERRAVRESSYYARPMGTWAGVLYGKSGRARLQIAECGTERGYQQHRYKREGSCAACKAAHAATWRERRRVSA